MHDLHIGDFCRDAARILVLLYKRFPTKSILYIEDIIGPDEPDEFGLHSPRHMACFHAALWLAEEGYFRFSQPVHQEALEDTVLSQASFLHFSSTDNPESSKIRISALEEIILERNSQRLNEHLLAQFKLFSSKV